MTYNAFFNLKLDNDNVNISIQKGIFFFDIFSLIEHFTCISLSPIWKEFYNSLGVRALYNCPLRLLIYSLLKCFKSK